jgi:hypothetical protein
MSEIEIYDNFLEEQSLKELQEIIYGGDELKSTFPWYYFPYKVFEDNTENLTVNVKYNFQLNHIFYMRDEPISSYFDLVVSMLDQFDPISILRIKANLNPVAENNTELFGMHEDFDRLTKKNVKYKTAIFYVNTNNGKTVFENGTVIDSIENRMIVFNGSLKHTATTHSDTKTRCVINFNYIG